MNPAAVKKGKVFVTTSGKGGVGKSTVTGNLGAALAALGNEVIIVDMDIGLRNMDILLGVESRVVFNIIDVADNACRVDQALVRSKFAPNLRLLPASQTKNKDDLREKDAHAIIELLREMADYILIDCPAGIESGFRHSISAADEALVVVNPEVSSIRDSDRVVGMLESMTKRVPSRLLINRYKPELVKRGDQMSIDDICEILSIDLIGVIPETENVVKGANRGELVPANTPEGVIFTEIARRMTGETVPVKVDFEEKKNGLAASFKSLRRLFSSAAC